MKAYTAAQVAERWQCSASHIRKMANNGQLPFFMAGGKLLRFTPETIEAYERCQSLNSNASVTDGHSQSTAEADASVVTRLKHMMQQERRRSSLAGSRS